MNAQTQMLVFVTPIDDRAVEVDTDELYEAGQPPHRVEGGLVEAARFVAAHYAERQPVLLSDKDAGSLEADALVDEFEQALRGARVALKGGVG